MKNIILLITIVILIAESSVFAESITVGLIQHDAGSLDEGYVLFSPNYSGSTYLIDKCGYVINKWISNYRPGFSAYLLPDGKLLRTNYLKNNQFPAGGTGGIIEKLDWDGNVLWSYTLSNEYECLHHDIKPMPNGNILAICWDKKTELEANTMGRKPTLIDSCVWSEKIIELRPVGTDSAEIVWEWKVWDHLVQNSDQNKPNYAEIAKHPELINLNFAVFSSLRDWVHCNSIDYNEKFDQILLSPHNFGEVWIIDHSTTKTEAAEHAGGKYGKGGDLLYRWGNPVVYGNGSATDQKFFFQHDAHWIPEGFPNGNCIRVFNNERMSNGVRFSSIDMFNPAVDTNGFYDSQLPYGPADDKWSYTAEEPQNFYSSILGSAQQLSNGNVLICDGGGGNFFEIDSAKNEVWRYINPVAISGVTMQGQSTRMENQLFRCTFYPNTYSAFAGKDLTRKGLVENKNANSAGCTLFTDVSEPPTSKELVVYPNPTNDYITVTNDINPSKLSILNLQGQELIIQNNSATINIKNLPSGMYILRITDSIGYSVYKIIAVTK